MATATQAVGSSASARLNKASLKRAANGAVSSYHAAYPFGMYQQDGQHIASYASYMKFSTVIKGMSPDERRRLKWSFRGKACNSLADLMHKALKHYSN